MKFKVIKVPLTEEEKRTRIEEFNMYEGADLDVEEFVSQDIYDEFIELYKLKLFFTFIGFYGIIIKA